jgi:predicted SprT family Zn-dependent metalloprotease
MSVSQFEQKVRECLAKAEELFGVDLSGVEISFKLKGLTAGNASNFRGKLLVRFNHDAVFSHWDHMVNSTIPHEVAHLVGMVESRSHPWARHIAGHNSYWERAACLLGDTDYGATTHNLPLAPAKQMNEYVYVDPCGEEMKISAVVHNRIQQGHVYTSRSTGHRIMPEYCKGSSKWSALKIEL